MKDQITLPSQFGALRITAIDHEGQTGVVVMNPDFQGAPFVRIHSSCLFSESFGTNDCDCGPQLRASLSHISKYGGILIYLYQEGRGLGLAEKIRAISLEQTEGIDTAKAFARLGHDPDPRSYAAAAHALKDLGIMRVVLATNNPRKEQFLRSAGIEVERRENLSFPSTPAIDEYVRVKREVLGHHGDD